MPLSHRSAGQAGYTLIEVMVAAMVLAVGVLGSFMLLDSANRTTDATTGGPARSTSHARSRSTPGAPTTTCLSPTQVETTLRARTRIAGAGAAGSWKIVRRGVTYSVTPTVCTFDDPKDGLLSAAPPPNVCTPGAVAIVGAPVEVNPDDFRRLKLTLSWNDRQGTHKVIQSALIVNPPAARARGSRRSPSQPPRSPLHSCSEPCSSGCRPPTR